MGIKGNLTEINAIPFEAPPLAPVRDGCGARFRPQFTLEDVIEFHDFALLEALAGV
jgi:hypothetical protein